MRLVGLGASRDVVRGVGQGEAANTAPSKRSDEIRSFIAGHQEVLLGEPAPSRHLSHALHAGTEEEGLVRAKAGVL